MSRKKCSSSLFFPLDLAVHTTPMISLDETFLKMLIKRLRNNESRAWNEWMYSFIIWMRLLCFLTLTTNVTRNCLFIIPNCDEFDSRHFAFLYLRR